MEAKFFALRAVCRPLYRCAQVCYNKDWKEMEEAHGAFNGSSATGAPLGAGA